MRRTGFGLLVAFGVLGLSAAWAGGIWMAGGKDLSPGNTTYLSPKMLVVSEDETAEEMFRFVFNSPFPLNRVMIGMEDELGNRILPGEKNAVAQVRIGKPRDATGENWDYVVDARVRTNRDAIRFSLTFADAHGYVRLDEVATRGRAVVARPVPAGAEGLRLTVRNTWDEKLCFFRGDLFGGLPKIQAVKVSDTPESFYVEITQDRRAFAVRGGRLDPGGTLDLFIRFAAPGTEAGALVLGAAYN